MAVAVKMGNGYYLNVETSQILDAEGAKYASAFAYWLACEAQIQPRETLTLTLEGLQVTARGSYAITLTANYPGGFVTQTVATVCRV